MRGQVFVFSFLSFLVDRSSVFTLGHHSSEKCIKESFCRHYTWYIPIKVTRPSFLRGVPSYFEALWYPHLYLYRKFNT